MKTTIKNVLVALLLSFVVMVGINLSPGNVSATYSGTQQVETGKVEINHASLEELQKITGVGPVIAQKIIDARPYETVDDLIKVSGIGTVTLQKIKDQGLAYVEKKSAPIPLENISAEFSKMSPNMWQVVVKSTASYSIASKAIRFYTDAELTHRFYEFPYGTTNVNGLGVVPEIYGGKGKVYITAQEAGLPESNPVEFVYDPSYVVGTVKTDPVPLDTIEVNELDTDFQISFVYNQISKYNTANKLFRFYLTEDKSKVLSGSKTGATFVTRRGYQFLKTKIPGNKIYLTVQEEGKLESDLIPITLREARTAPLTDANIMKWGDTITTYYVQVNELPDYSISNSTLRYYSDKALTNLVYTNVVGNKIAGINLPMSLLRLTNPVIYITIQKEGELESTALEVPFEYGKIIG